MRRRDRGVLPRLRSGLLLLAAVAVLSLQGAPEGVGQQGGPLVAQPTLGTPPGVGTMIGAAPDEAPGALWSIQEDRVARYTDATGWQTLPRAVDRDGKPLTPLTFASGALAGRTTGRGGVVLLGQISDQGVTRQLVIVRDPGGPLREASPTAAPTPTPTATATATATATPDPSAVLRQGESLYSGSRVLTAAVEQSGGRTGAFLVPAVTGSTIQDSVLHYDGSAWAREPICLGASASPCQAPASGFEAVGIDASAEDNAWLLVKSGQAGDGVVLLARETAGGAPIWRPRSLGGSPFASATPTLSPDVTVGIAVRAAGQPLTVTADGVWVDALVTIDRGASTDATLYFDPASTSVTDTWCDVPDAVRALCKHRLDAELAEGQGRSFAWVGDGLGQRVITGIEQGVVLRLDGTRFTRVPTAGGDAGARHGAAFSAPDDAWLGSTYGPVHLTRNPQPNRLQPWAVPFRRPLTAVAPEPGKPKAGLDSQALAVGDQGQVARYIPGQGWQPEYLLNAAGARARPRLRGVAWPEASRAHAVGDNAQMWLWRAQTGLWEPDPAMSPNLARANFTGIAFDPTEPTRGYAIGKQGLLLHYGREWVQDTLPTGLDPRVNFTSIAFAGREALVTYKFPRDNAGEYDGGVIVNDGSGWRIDPAPNEALTGSRRIPERVAGLEDGGVVVASSSGEVVVRDSASSTWRTVPGGGLGYPTTVAAFREGELVRAVVAVEAVGAGGSQVTQWATDADQIFNEPPPGQAPLLTDPYPLAASGFVVRETANGWRDEQHQAYPVPEGATGQPYYDLPVRPDSVLALLVSSDGMSGWAVGGETGAASQRSPLTARSVQTAGIMRYPAEVAPPAGASSAPIDTTGGTATIAIGGGAQCAAACADLRNARIGPDAWLPAAVGTAARAAGARVFVSSGRGLADGLATALSRDGFGREAERSAQRLSEASGSTPVFAAPAASDLDGAGTLASFDTAFAAFSAPLGQGAAAPGITPSSPPGPTAGAYAFDSAGSGGSVRVIVLDYSRPTLGDAQSCWLAEQLAGAGAAQVPAIVVGNRDLSAGQRSPTAASDGAAVAALLVTGTPPLGCAVSAPPSGASAYFFDYPEQNRTYPLTAGGRSIPSFGSGTLGYVTPPTPAQTDFVGASGFLLAEIDVAHRDPGTNVAPVRVRLIPNIGDLALDATDGTLLRRSQPALFEALARRPRAGMRCEGPAPSCGYQPDPYVAIPAKCQGAQCASGMFPEYSFSSSNPDIADFVETDPASLNPRRVLLDANDQTSPSATSGLLCAFNAGRTNVIVKAGGLTYSIPVTVQAGSPQRPCGTVPLKNPPQRPGGGTQEPPPPPSDPAEEPEFESGSTPLPPPPPPDEPAEEREKRQRSPVTPVPPPNIPSAFLPPELGISQITVTVPPPPPSAARPAPPSGTSSVQVSQPVPAPERQREEEEATDMAHNYVAVSASGAPPRGLPLPLYLPALVLLLALAGTTFEVERRRRGWQQAPVRTYPDHWRNRR